MTDPTKPESEELGDEWFSGLPIESSAILSESTDLAEWGKRIVRTLRGILKGDPTFFKRSIPDVTLELGELSARIPFIKPPAGADLEPIVAEFMAALEPINEDKPRESFSVGAPDLIADAWVRQVATIPEGVTVHRWDAAWWIWTGTHSVRQSEEDQRSQVGRFIRSAIDLVGFTKKGERQIRRPNRALYDNVMDALRIQLNLGSTVKPPLWISDDPTEPQPEAKATVAVDNGLLTLSTGELQPPSPRFFCLSALKTQFQPRAKCPQWGSFLSELWDDRPSQETLQEMFGYLLTAETRQQKAFMIVGPPRSGKGTIGRILAALLGPDAVSRPALADFGTPFGLEPLIGKGLAIISDARLDGNVPVGVLAERLLAISGEDTINIARKYKEAWNGPLSVRFLLLTNELPRFRDASGALPNRFIVLKMTKTWLGKEDPGLFERLVTELPGILNWAMEGWMRLQERGHFIQPDSARDMVEQMQLVANPLAAFVEEACELGEDQDASITELYRHYVDWAKRGESKPMPVTIFGRDLRAALPALRFYKPHGEPRRIKGIGIKWFDPANSSGSGPENSGGKQDSF